MTKQEWIQMAMIHQVLPIQDIKGIFPTILKIKELANKIETYEPGFFDRS